MILKTPFGQRHTARLALCLFVFGLPSGSEAQQTKPPNRSGDRSTVAVASLPSVRLPTGPRLRDIAPLNGPVPLLVGGTIGAPLLGTSA